MMAPKVATVRRIAELSHHVKVAGAGTECHPMSQRRRKRERQALCTEDTKDKYGRIPYLSMSCDFASSVDGDDEKRCRNGRSLRHLPKSAESEKERASPNEAWPVLAAAGAAAAAGLAQVPSDPRLRGRRDHVIRADAFLARHCRPTPRVKPMTRQDP